MNKRSIPRFWRGKQASKVRVALTGLEPVTLREAEVFVASIFGRPRKNTQAMPPTEAEVAVTPALTHYGAECFVERMGVTIGAPLCDECGHELATHFGQPCPKKKYDPLAEAVHWVTLHLHGADGWDEAHRVRESVPGRLYAWVDDALRALRDAGKVQCLTFGGVRVWRLRCP